MKKGRDGVGEHMLTHVVEIGLDLNFNKDMEALMQNFHLAVFGSVHN